MKAGGLLFNNQKISNNTICRLEFNIEKINNTSMTNRMANNTN